MTYVPHARLTMQGDLPNGEMFSCNLSLAPSNDNVVDAILAAVVGITNAAFADLVADCTTFWADQHAWISSRAILKMIKLAPIDSLGHYAGAPKEAAVNVPGGGGPAQGAADMFPHQVARKVTFETAGDLGRIKGGFYLPGVTQQGFDVTTDLTSVGVVTDVRTSLATFINALDNWPGFDVAVDWNVVVASQGRHRNGVQTVAPKNWKVTGVNVGRRLDTQRRRANKLGEARIGDAAVG